MPAEHTVGPQLRQLPPLFHCCCFPIAWLPQLVSFGSRTGLQGVETAPAQRCWSLSRAWARALGSGPGTAVTTKQLKLRRLGEVLAAGVILGLACHPAPVSSGSWEGGGTLDSISGPSPSSLFAFFPVCPEGWGQRALWRVLGGPGSNGGQGGACPPSLCPAFWRQGVLLPAPLSGFGLQLQADGRAGALVSDLEGSHPAVPLSLHVACRKWRGDQQEFPAAQAPVGLCTWGCPPPTPPPPPGTPSWARRTR